MGLKCSLLGHSFDESDVERHREERGSEVVTVAREVERCSRCGTTRVVSENKEVTSIVEPDDVGLDDGGVEPSAASSTALGDLAAGSEDDGGSFDAGGDLDDEYEPPDDPAEEDAEILEDDRRSERRPGQWPGDDDEWSADRLTGGSAAGDDRDDAAGPGENIAADATGDREPSTGTGHAPGENSSAAGDASAGERSRDDGGEVIDAETGAGGGSDRDGAAARDPTGGAEPGSDADGEYVCPECGFAASVEHSPLRAGDACPECKRGYLEIR